MFRLKLTIVLLLAVFAGVLYFIPDRFAVARGRAAVAAIDAPTDVEASDSKYAAKVYVRWDTMRGAVIYRIFRNTVNNSASAQDVGTTTANYFFDTPPTAAVNYYYWIRAENGSTVSPIGYSDTGARAVGNDIPGEFGPLEPPTAPAENPVTAAKSYLGKALFWDEQLSSTKTVSCGTCRRPAAGGSDPRTVDGDALSRNPGPDNIFNSADDFFGSPGVPQNNLDGTYAWNTLFKFGEQVTGRKSPSYLKAGYTRGGLFWDGRAADAFRDQLTDQVLITGFGGLESQSAGPPVSSGEMGHTSRNWTQVASRIASSRPLALSPVIPAGLRSWIGCRTYPVLFQDAFGSPEVTPSRISMAIATHERTLFTDQTPIDLAEQQIAPLTAEEQSGRNVFVSLQCSACHGGPLVSDNNFHNIGVRPQSEDIGRGAFTGQTSDNAKFKTPSLRNLFLRGPFLHNGGKDSIEAVIELYNRGGDFDAPNIDRDLVRPLGLSNQQRADLAAFLKRPLVDPRVASELPPFDRPQLYTESNRVPVITGSGRAGSGSLVPVAKAIEPPYVGNPSFTVGVSGALGGSSAVVVISASDPGVGSSIPVTGDLVRAAITLSGSGSGNGYGSVSIALANNASLAGQTFYGRWYVTDAAAANGFAVSRLFTFKIFTPDAGTRRTMYDYDGDGKTDASVYRPSNNAFVV